MNSTSAFFALAAFFCLIFTLCSGLNAPISLYDADDSGVVILEAGNFTGQVTGSKTAWLVEFYSAYCGHCINFAPHFKKFARFGADWKAVIKIGVVNCADSLNLDICREYDIYQYPTLKFFPPMASDKDPGEMRAAHSSDLEELASDTLLYVQKARENSSLASYVHHWPDLAAVEPSQLLSSSHDLVLVVDTDDSSILGRHVLMQLASVAASHSAMIRRATLTSSTAEFLLKYGISVPSQQGPMIVSWRRAGKAELLYSFDGGDTMETNKKMLRAVQKFLREEQKPASTNSGPAAPPGKALPMSEFGEKVTNEKEITRRRYTVFMSDLENTVLYALSHEVSQHSVISDKALTALQDFVDVLIDFLPARPQTLVFLQRLKLFIGQRADAVKGHDLQQRIDQLKAETGAFSDLPNHWIACQGSKSMFGGYPCGLWTLWHTLTVAQWNSKPSQQPKQVLKTMVAFVSNFFSCRECARHFMLEAESGAAIDREVDSAKASVLWLWKTHNKVNRRLSGDLTDDRAFPKEIFPNKKRCPGCYDSSVLGSDLWSEFRINAVLDFLNQLYGRASISLDQLSSSSSVRRNAQSGVEPSVLATAIKETLDKSNFSEDENGSWIISWTNTDVTLWLIIYVSSALMMILVCTRFVAKRRCGVVLAALCGRLSGSHKPKKHSIV